MGKSIPRHNTKPSTCLVLQRILRSKSCQSGCVQNLDACKSNLQGEKQKGRNQSVGVGRVSNRENRQPMIEGVPDAEALALEFADT